MGGKEDTWKPIPTKERIAKVALRLFSIKGFKGTTIKDIATEVGITEGAIYRHFSSKEEIVAYLLSKISSDLGNLIEKKALSKGNIKAKVSSLIDILLWYAFEHPDAFRFLTVYHILRHNRRNTKLPGSIVIELLRKAYAKGRLLVSPEVALSMIVGSVERLFILWELGMLSGDKGRIASEVKEAVLRALFGCV